MLRYIYATDLNDHPKLARTMFRDRADQFKFRLPSQRLVTFIAKLTDFQRCVIKIGSWSLQKHVWFSDRSPHGSAR